MRKIFGKAVVLFTLVIGMSVGLNNYEVYADSIQTVNVDVMYLQTSARSMIDMINEFRTGSDAWAYNSSNEKVYYNNLATLSYDCDLEKVAMLRAAEIAIAYGHTRPNSKSFGTAYSELNVNFGIAGENIAAGLNAYTNAAEVFEGWQENDEPYSGQGHRRNMLNGYYTAIGIGHVYYNSCHYWVQEFRSFSGTVTETVAVDGNQNINVDIDTSVFSIDLTPSKNSISIYEGESEAIPTVNAIISAPSDFSAGFISYPYGKSTVGASTTWSVSDSSIIQIKDGKITSINSGSASITATALGKEITIPVTVSKRTCTHIFSTEWTIDKAATQTEPGSKSHHCTRSGCDAKSDVTSIPIISSESKDKDAISDNTSDDASGSTSGSENTDSSGASTDSGDYLWPNEIVDYSNYTFAYSKKSHTFTINKARAWYGFLAFSSVDNKLKVTSDGTVTIPKKFGGVAKIKITTTDPKHTIVSKIITVKIKPEQAKITTVKNSAKGTCLLKWTKQSYATGYEIEYGTSSSFKRATVVDVKKASTVKYTFKKLKKGKTYYFRIRAYKTVNGEKIYGSYSAKKSIKITK